MNSKNSSCFFYFPLEIKMAARATVLRTTSDMTTPHDVAGLIVFGGAGRRVGRKSRGGKSRGVNPACHEAGGVVGCARFIARHGWWRLFQRFPDYEKRHSSEIRRSDDFLRVRVCSEDSFDGQRNEHQYLLGLPSLFHGAGEVY